MSKPKELILIDIDNLPPGLIRNELGRIQIDPSWKGLKPNDIQAAKDALDGKRGTPAMESSRIYKMLMCAIALDVQPRSVPK